MLEEILNRYDDQQFLKADGFDKAVIGVEESSMRLIYSVKKCIKILRKKNKWSWGEAWEYFDHNVSGAYVGEKTPIFCDDDF